jgi:hypothetical protein
MSSAYCFFSIRRRGLQRMTKATRPLLLVFTAVEPKAILKSVPSSLPVPNRRRGHTQISFGKNTSPRPRANNTAAAVSEYQILHLQTPLPWHCKKSLISWDDPPLRVIYSCKFGTCPAFKVSGLS